MPGVVEYVLVTILVAVIVIVILTLLGPSIGNVYSSTGPYIELEEPPNIRLIATGMAGL